MCLLLASALALRLWGNTVGLPAEYVPDEESKVRTILTLSEHNFTHWESQPSFTYYSLFVIYKAMDPWKEGLMEWDYLSHRFSGPKGDSAYYRWIGRCWMAVLSTMTVFFLYRLGKALYSRAAGFIGAAVYTASPLAIALTHYLKEDTPLALFLVLTALMCVRVIQKRRKKDYILAGIAGGLAFASKYPGASSLIMIAAAVIFASRAEIREAPSWKGKLRLFHRRARLPVASFVITFFLVCPTYLNVWALSKGLYFQSDYVLSGHHDGVLVQFYHQFMSFYIRKSVIPGIGLPAFLAAIGGLYIGFRRMGAAAWIVGGYAVGYLFIAELLPSKPYPFFSRYIIPSLPFLCVFAGVFIAVLPRMFPSRTGYAISTAAVILAVGTPLYLSIQFLRHTDPDTRDLARVWLEENLPENAAVFIATPRYDVDLSGGHFVQRLLYRRSWNYRIAEYQLNGHEAYAVISSFDYDRYLDNVRTKRKAERSYDMYTTIMEEEELLHEFAANAPAYGYHNPTVRVYKFGPPKPEDAEKARKIMSGEKEDEYATDDLITQWPPFPERLGHM